MDSVKIGNFVTEGEVIVEDDFTRYPESAAEQEDGEGDGEVFNGGAAGGAGETLNDEQLS